MKYKIIKYSGLLIAFVSIITMAILAILGCMVPDIIQLIMCFGLIIEFIGLYGDGINRKDKCGSYEK